MYTNSLHKLMKVRLSLSNHQLQFQKDHFGDALFNNCADS